LMRAHLGEKQPAYLKPPRLIDGVGPFWFRLKQNRSKSARSLQRQAGTGK
jgi:hypothetical protein